MDVFDLFAKLSLDSSEYEKGLDKAKTQGSKLASGLGTAMKVGAGAVAAVGTAAVAAGAALVKESGNVAEYGDHIDKMSQKIGISAEAYQEWDAVLQHSGASVDSLQMVMKTLSTQAEKGSDAFAKLGISQSEVANMSKEDLFGKVITGLQGMEEGTERTYLATQLLGRGATEFGALLNTSAEDTQKMIDTVHELGGVMSDDAVKASAEYQDRLQDMNTALDGMKRNLLSNFLPGLSMAMDGLTKVFSGKTEEGLDTIEKGVGDLASKLTQKLPEALNVGVRIIEGISQSVIQNIPTIMPALTELVLHVAEYTINSLPQLIDVGLQVLITLADGITQALPTLIPALTDVIYKIVEVLTEPETLSQLIDVAIELVLALTEGMIDALPRLIDATALLISNLIMVILQKIPEILGTGEVVLAEFLAGILMKVPDLLEGIGKIMMSLIAGIVAFFVPMEETGDELLEKIAGAIDEGVQKAKKWGTDLIENFIGGIKSKIGAVKDAVGNVASTVKDFLGFSEPDEGPLSNFHTFAPDMIDLFAKGIDAGLGKVQEASANFAYAMAPQMADVSSVEVAGAGGDIIIPIYLGSDKIDEVIVNAEQTRNYRGGGR
jgi:phage-related protein